MKSLGLFAISLLMAAQSGLTQTNSKVENLGTATANQAANGLGFNLNPANEWEFQMAAAAGATTVRFQCSWVSVETQSEPPQNTNDASQYVLPTDCQSGLAYSRKYSMRPTVVAAYGSPFHKILQVSLNGTARAGATTLNIQFASGVGGSGLSKIAFPYDTIIATSGNQITRVHSYAGGLITGVKLTDATHATLTLASALVSDLLPGQLYTINEYLYPPAATFSPLDPSNVAFANYAEFLASSIANEGLQGEIEIWNEPPWPDDPWDERANFYDVFPGTATTLPQPFMPNFGFVAAIQSQVSPAPGVTYVWGGTEKSGASSLFDWMKMNTGTSLIQPAQIVTAESIHPYGNTPEDGLWIESCLKSTILSYPNGPTAFYPCNLFGLPGGNASLAEQFSLVKASLSPNWGLRREITETGFGNAYGDAKHKARFLLRQFLGYQAQGVSPIEFYRLWDQSTEDFGFAANNLVTNAITPYLSYNAMSGLMSDIATIKAAPVTAISSSTLPLVQSYAGTYPLDTVALVGADTGATENSILFALWQRSNGQNWGSLPSPLAGIAVLAVPSGLEVSQVVDLVTRANVAYKLVGQTMTLAVSDDPVEVLLLPVTVTGISLTPSSTSVAVGSTVTLSCSATLANGTHTVCNSPAYDSSNTNVARLSGSTAAAEGAGATTLTAAVGSHTASAPLTVLAITPTLAITPIPSQIAGSPAFSVSSISPSLGAINYSIVSGPATISGRLVTVVRPGTVVLKASQTAYGNYTAGQAQTSFLVKSPSTSVSLSLPVNVVSNTLALPGTQISITQKGSASPTGTVQILDNGKSIWSYSLSASAHGSLGGITISPMSVGIHNLSAYYSGDANYTAGASSAFPVTVVAYQSAILGSCTNGTLTYGQALSCTVTGTAGTAALTGAVTYTVNGVSGTKLLSGGKGTIVIPNLPRGSGSLIMRYLQQGSNPACPYSVNLPYTVN